VEELDRSAKANFAQETASVKSASVMGIRLASLTRQELIECLLDFARGSKPRLVTYLNAHNVNVYFRDPEYARIIDRADTVYADGQSLIWASRLFGEPLPERISAAYFFSEFCKRSAKDKLNIFLIGSRPGVAERAQKNLQHHINGLQIVGTHHGHFQRA
jgi:N-acetylglucosaminyldiphosphoundecaprenol N-acetyl-beta-D-mannosaminyltransferase